MISATEVSLDVAPGAVDSTPDRAALLYVTDPVLMQSLLNLAAEFRTFQRFGCEIAP
jgi:hypothetical protein